MRHFHRDIIEICVMGLRAVSSPGFTAISSSVNILCSYRLKSSALQFYWFHRERVVSCGSWYLSRSTGLTCSFLAMLIGVFFQSLVSPQLVPASLLFYWEFFLTLEAAFRPHTLASFVSMAPPAESVSIFPWLPVSCLYHESGTRYIEILNVTVRR